MRSLTYIGFVFILASCQMVVDVDVPMKPPLITVNCAFTSDSSWTVFLHKSKYILDEGQHKEISNAVVKILENGTLVDQLTYGGLGQYTSTTGKKPEDGKPYTIEVSAPGMQSVSAESKLPAAIDIKDARVQRTFGGSSSNNFSIDLSFQDNGNTEDFYEILVVTEYWYIDWQTRDTAWQKYPSYIYTDDLAISQDGVNVVIFDDKIINGKEVKVRVKGNDFNNHNGKFWVTLRSLSKELYLYKLTSSLQSYSSDDPFAQPVHVSNNIKNGFGVFGGYRETTMTVQ